LWALAAPVSGAATRITFTPGGPSRGVFEVDPSDAVELEALERAGAERWPELFAVYVAGPEKGGERPAMLGSYTLRERRLRFEPRYPLEPGLRYRAVYRAPGNAAAPIAEEFALPPRPPGAPPTVTAVYPSSSRVPENLLRIYLHFSAPMRRGEAYRHLQLVSASGRPVELPFLEIDEELWDRDGRRLTLLFDPGRIKRGLRPREEVGPILEEGKQYRLLVTQGWRDAEGNPLARDFEKQLVAGPPDEGQPDPGGWRIEVPRAGTREPLHVAFPEPLDHAMLERVLEVIDAGGHRIAGTVRVGTEERAWSFAPADPWRAGEYRLSVDAALEDLAGNNVASRFVVDAFDRVTRRVEAGRVTRPFAIR
jgi:hypothetical protein